MELSETLQLQISKTIDASYNMGISHAIDIVEGNYATMHLGSGATGKSPELLLSQILTSLKNLKKNG